MKGFKDFVMRGNLVELAVAFIIGAAFATVVKAFTDVLLSLIGKVGGQPDFNNIKPGGVPVGAFLTALVAFLIVAGVVYLFVVKPYEAAKARFARTEVDAAPDPDVVVLTEIRDLLADVTSSIRGGSGTGMG
ncbi:MAG: large conductance mechanosensitive channel protein MscL [Actinomycetota bacterium]|nr:large conductance mechanosensitive channel protein MscL [Actinomycetota bacterium]